MIRCLCGSTLAAVASDTGGETARTIIYHCDTCGHNIAIQLHVRDLGLPTLGPRRDTRPHRKPPTTRPQCGTDNGYRNHSYHNEQACQACTNAHTTAAANYRKVTA